MRRRTSFGNRPVSYLRKAQVALLCLLAVATTCLGRQGQPQPQARRATAARLKVIQLPEPVTSSAVSLEQTLLGNRNMQPPGNQRLDLPKVGQLAWAAQRAMTTPSSSATGPAAVAAEALAMRVYFILPDGVFLYNPVDHTLQQTSDEDMRDEMAAGLSNQTGTPTGGCQIIVAAAPQEFSKRYGPRGRTAMLLEAGRMSQSIQLQAIALSLTFVGIDGVDTAAVRRVARLPRNLEPIYAAFVGYPAGQAPQSAIQDSTPQTGRRALLVVPPQGFQDEELTATRRALELAGVQVMVASTRLGQLTGVLGGTTRADLLLNQAKVDDFNAIVFIGGVDIMIYANNSFALNLARQAAPKRKVLAAIGTAPSILAGAGVLRGVRSTAYLSEQDRMVQAGAIYTGNPVEKDGFIVTATGPLAAATFARAILDGLVEAQ